MCVFHHFSYGILWNPMDMLFIDVFAKIQKKARRHEFGEVHQDVHVVLRKANMGMVTWGQWLKNKCCCKTELTLHGPCMVHEPWAMGRPVDLQERLRSSDHPQNTMPILVFADVFHSCEINKPHQALRVQ